MAFERAPRLGAASGTRTLDELKAYKPPAESVLRWYPIGRRPGGEVESLADVAKVSGKDFWAYIEYVFPGCDKTPECVNWYLNYRYGCPQTRDGKNRAFKGGEMLPLPKLDWHDAKPNDPAKPPAAPKPGFYDRQAAVRYARTYHKTPNPAYPQYPNDCTSFVSQALLAGGWPMIGGTVWDRDNTDAWWYGRVRKEDYRDNLPLDVVDGIKDIFRDPFDIDERHRSSRTWAGAPDLALFFKRTNRAFEMRGPEHLEPGDVIQIRGKADKKLEHAMFIIGRNGNDLTYAQHSPNKIESYNGYLRPWLSANYTKEVVHWKVRDIIEGALTYTK